jgi:hypothetical protein
MKNRIKTTILNTSIRNFVEEYSTETTLFLPSIQRGDVWTDVNKKGYMDAIQKNMTPTPIILVDIESSIKVAKELNNQDDVEELTKWYEQGYRHISTDGGNRTRFLNEEYKKLNGNFKNLPEDIKNFLHHPIQVLVFDNMTFDEMHEVACKVNMGVPWSKADKRNTLRGPVPKYVRNITNKVSETFSLFLSSKEISSRKVDELVGYFLCYHQTKVDTLNQKSLDTLYKSNNIVNKEEFEKVLSDWDKVIKVIHSKKHKITKPFSTKLFIFLLEVRRTENRILNLETIDGFVEKYVELEEKRIVESFDKVTGKSSWIDGDRYAKDYSAKYLKIYQDFFEFFGDYFISKDTNRAFTTDKKIQKIIETDGMITNLDGTTSKIGILQALNGNHIHGDHIKPHSKGGATDIDNLQFLTKEDNLKKSDS